ncbi:hypothetical protein Sjap_006774 [Stephania japonica]|uniref:Disease resistance N-terminal domain-containing protein n=1 Tax=Stephania japonica TaxID=461633 RepID=A0AAP0K6L0_9MAGN
MAEVVAGPLIEILISSIQREIALVWVVKTEARKLSNTLSAIRDVLADAEEKQIKNKKVRDWLMRLKDVAYDAQDVLDDCTDVRDLWIKGCPGVVIPKGELDPLVALRAPSFLNNIDKELIHDQEDSTIPETSGKQVLD